MLSSSRNRRRRFVVRKSPIHGRGVFALQPIPKGTRLMEYTGERISHEVADDRYGEEHEHSPHTMLFAVDDETVIDATHHGSSARYINHSCTPNCYTRIIGDTIWIIAARNIERGAELTYDYSTDGVGAIQCRCRPGCETRL